MLRALGLAAFVLLVIAMAVVGPNRVLCVSADGHVGVEPAHSACCDASPGADEQSPAEPADCGACVDIEMPTAFPALGSAPAQTVGEHLPTSDSPPQSSASLRLPIRIAVAIAPPHRRSLEPPPQAVELLRTIRLRV